MFCREVSMKKGKAKEGRFPVGRFFAWKTRDVSLGCMTIILGYLSLYAALMMGSKIFDAVTDLFAGYLVDNTNTRLGKARPYEFAVIGAWGSTILLFSCPESFSMTAKCIWIFSMYTLTYSIFATLLFAGQQPYIVRAFANRAEIIKVSSFGGIVSTLGAASVSVSFPILVKRIAVTPAGWSRLVLIFAVPLAALGMLRFIFVKEIYEPAESKGKAEKVSLKQIISMLRKNPYIWDVGVIAGAVQFIMGMNAAVYYFQFIVGDIAEYRSVGQLVVMFSTLGICGYIVNFFAGSGMAMLMVAFFATGLAQLPGSYLQSPMLMECAAYNESMGLPRMDSTSAAVMNFLMKVMNAVGAGLLGLLLQASGFIATKSGETVVQPGSALMMIRLLYSAIPALVLLATIFAAKHFDGLDRKLKEIKHA